MKLQHARNVERKECKKMFEIRPRRYEPRKKEHKNEAFKHRKKEGSFNTELHIEQRHNLVQFLVVGILLSKKSPIEDKSSVPSAGRHYIMLKTSFDLYNQIEHILLPANVERGHFGESIAVLMIFVPFELVQLWHILFL